MAMRAGDMPGMALCLVARPKIDLHYEGWIRLAILLPAFWLFGCSISSR
jgi:hypothetical protein